MRKYNLDSNVLFNVLEYVLLTNDIEEEVMLTREGKSFGDIYLLQGWTNCINIPLKITSAKCDEYVYDFLKKQYRFDIYTFDNRYDIDILKLVFCLLHECGHLLDRIRDEKIQGIWARKLKSNKDYIANSTRPIFTENGLKKNFYNYRKIATERVADIFAMEFLINHREEILDIINESLEESIDILDCSEENEYLVCAYDHMRL